MCIPYMQQKFQGQIQTTYIHYGSILIINIKNLAELWRYRSSKFTVQSQIPLQLQQKRWHKITFINYIQSPQSINNLYIACTGTCSLENKVYETRVWEDLGSWEISDFCGVEILLTFFYINETIRLNYLNL